MSVERLLSKVAPEVDLEKNRDQNPILRRKLTPGEQRAIGRIAERFLSLPLTHVTRSKNVEPIMRKGLRPYSEIGNPFNGNTFGIDKFIGLDEFVFASLGPPNWNPTHYGSSMIILPGELMSSDRVTVAPRDLIKIVSFEADNASSWKELCKSDQEAIKWYCRNLLLGGDWIEYLARRTLKQYGKSGLVPTLAYGGINTGEVHHLGTIDSSKIEQVIPSRGEAQIELARRVLLETGFYSREAVNKDGSRKEILPEGDVKKIQKEWNEIWEMAYN